jgi:hypothetical protein
MHAKDFQEPKGDTIWKKHHKKHEDTQKCHMTKGCPNYIKE